jgi:hypothetical protein
VIEDKINEFAVLLKKYLTYRITWGEVCVEVAQTYSIYVMIKFYNNGKHLELFEEIYYPYLCQNLYNESRLKFACESIGGKFVARMVSMLPVVESSHELARWDYVRTQ